MTVANCPGCKIETLQVGLYRMCEQEIERDLPDEEAFDADELDGLMDDVIRADQMMRDNGGRIDTAWPASFVGFCRAVTAGQDRIEFAERWNEIQAAKQRASGGNR